MRLFDVRSCALRFRLWAGVFALACVPLAHAAGGFKNVQATGSSSIYWDQGLITPNVGWTPTVINGPDGPSFKTSAQLPVNGKNVPIDVVAKVPRSTAVTAAKKLLSVVPLVGNAIAIADLASWAASELSAEEIQLGNNGVHQQKKRDAVVSAGRCNQTGVFYPSGGLSSIVSQCATDLLGSYSYTGTGYIVGAGIPQAAGAYYTTRYNIQTVRSDGVVWVGGSVDVVESVNVKWEPITTQEIADAIASKSGWPTSDAAKAATASSLATALTYPDTQLPAEAPVVTGPSSVTGTPETSTTTTRNPDGSTSSTTTTKTPTHSITYSNNTANYQTTYVTTTSTINNSTNQTTTSTTTTNAPPAAETNPTPSDCEKNPDTIGCSKYGSADSDTLKKETVPFSITPTIFASSAGCPAPLTFDVIGHAYAVSYSPLCDIAVYLKVLFLAIAGVMAAYILADSFRV